VRNAALQILLERCIGIDFRFNDQVYMVASGNLGDADNTDVEEFDAALNNRLIHFKHELTVAEWIEGYAKDNVLPLITGYLKNNPEEFYKRTEGKNAYATPRSWTFLNDFIVSFTDGQETDTKNLISVLQKVGANYVGPCITKFIRYIEDMSLVNIQDIICRFSQIKDEVKKFNRSKISELLNNLKEIKVGELDDEKIANVSEFLNLLADDELMSYLLHLIDNETTTEEVPAKVRTLIAPYQKKMAKAAANLEK
jgi:hypothetical protein